MKALLMHRDRDFDLQQTLPWNARALTQDLELNTLFRAMAAGDDFLLDVARKAVLSGLCNDTDTILYRQEILKDCLKNPAAVRDIYALAVEAIEARKRHWLGALSRYPSGILWGAIELLRMLMDMLRKLKSTAGQHANRFESNGFRALFAMLAKELSDEYLANVRNHLAELRFRKGVLMSAELGEGNEGSNYVLRKARGGEPNWLARLLGKRPPSYTFHIHPRDEYGSRALSEIRDQGINLVANALAQSADHVMGFFHMLRTELAFYVACLNLHDRLVSKGAPVYFPRPRPAGGRCHRFSGLYDVCLALTMDKKVVGNAVNADGRSLAIITGANQGGKSSFLRGVGLAQLMMQCGLFVGAESFEAELCAGLATHYKREEDPTMKSGKFDEELARMSEIVDHIAPNSLLLLNESFAATNEREGSEIARQIVRALLEKAIKVFFVTHLYEFAHGFFDRKTNDTLFLRAERLPDGTRTFRLIEGEPLETSYGEDLYRKIFAPQAEKASTGYEFFEPGSR